MTPEEEADKICNEIQAEYGEEVWITDGHNAGGDFRDKIANAIRKGQVEVLREAATERWCDERTRFKLISKADSLEKECSS